MAISPRVLSGSTNGRGVVITSTTAGSGNILHTTVTGAGATTFDETYIYGMNLTTTAKLLTLNAGGTASGDKVRFSVPERGQGPFLLIPGWRYNGGVTIRAYATAASKVSCHGYVNRNA